MNASRRAPRQPRIDLSQLGQSGAVAALVADNFTVPDFNIAAQAAERGGYRTTIASPVRSLVSGRSEAHEEMNFVVDAAPGAIDPAGFAGLVLPGGAASVERLTGDADARALILAFIEAGKPVFAAGEAVALLAEVAGKDGADGEAAVALKGEVFAGGGETAREDAASAFAASLQPVKNAA